MSDYTQRAAWVKTWRWKHWENR